MLDLDISPCGLSQFHPRVKSKASESPCRLLAVYLEGLSQDLEVTMEKSPWGGRRAW